MQFGALQIRRGGWMTCIDFYVSQYVAILEVIDIQLDDLAETRKTPCLPTGKTMRPSALFLRSSLLSSVGFQV